MSTATTTQPPAAGHVMTPHRQPAAAIRPRSRAPLIAAALACVLLVSVAWLGFGWIRQQRHDDAISVFTVTKRSFPVILPEKGELKAGKSVDVKSEVEGRSTIIWLIPEGTEVKQGDLLVKLASNEIEEKVRNHEIKEANATAALEAAQKEYEILLDENASEIRKAELALDNARTDLKKYLEGDWVQAKLAADLEVERAEKVLERAQSDYDDSMKLYEKKFIPRGEMLTDEFDLYQAQVELEKAKLALRILETYTHPKDLRQKESDVSEAEKELERVTKNAAAKKSKQVAEVEAKKAELDFTRQQLTKYKDQQAKTEIKAPAAGLVVYDVGENRWDRRQITEGSEVFERQTIIKLPDTTTMVVKVRIHEAKTDKIKVGQPARVTVEGLPGRQYTGKITKIAVLADSSNQWLNPDLKEYETEITLDQSDPDLKPGVTAQAEIIADEVVNSLAIPTQSVFMKGGHAYVFRGTSEANAEPVEVKLGLSSTEFVTVQSGLDEDDRILLAASDDLKRRLPEPPTNENPASEDDREASAEARPAAPPARPPARTGGNPGGGGRQGGGRSRSDRRPSS